MKPTQTSRRQWRRVLVAGSVVIVGVLAAGCGGSTPSASPSTVLAGQVPKSQLAGTGSKDGSGSTSTVPLAQQNPISAMFTSLSTFQSCLQGLGVTFIGAPNASDPNSPANNPQYIKNLTTCAAQSNILQALKTVQSAQDNLTQAQIHTENNDYLKWRTCMIGRGWGIPQPTPNAQGLLFSFGGESVPDFTPPAGKNILSSNDMQACASKVTNGAIG